MATYFATIPDNTIIMASPKDKRTKQGSSKSASAELAESRKAEALTVAWIVTLTTVFFCNLAAILSHFYVAAYPEAQRMLMLRELLLFSGTLIGLLSLAILPLVNRLRRSPPPRALVAFGVCIALAPILTLLLRVTR